MENTDIMSRELRFHRKRWTGYPQKRDSGNRQNAKRAYKISIKEPLESLLPVIPGSFSPMTLEKKRLEKLSGHVCATHTERTGTIDQKCRQEMKCFIRCRHFIDFQLPGSAALPHRNTATVSDAVHVTGTYTTCKMRHARLMFSDRFD